MKKISLYKIIILVLIVVIIFLIISIIKTSSRNKTTSIMLNKINQKSIELWGKPELTRDLDEDGIKEWLVIDGPHGSGGYVSFNLFSMVDNQPAKVFSSEVFYQGKIGFEENKIKVNFGYPRIGDSNCCPSRTKERFYIYKNNNLILENERIINK